MSGLAQLRVKYMDRARGVTEVVSRDWNHWQSLGKAKETTCNGISIWQVDLGSLQSKGLSFVKENKITPTKRKKIKLPLQQLFRYEI